LSSLDVVPEEDELEPPGYWGLPLPGRFGGRTLAPTSINQSITQSISFPPIRPSSLIYR